jgi:hypothetical protein
MRRVERTPLPPSWLTVVVTAALVVVGEGFAAQTLHRGGDLIRNLRLVQLGGAVVVLAISFAFRHRWSRGLATCLFVLLMAPAYPITWSYTALAVEGTAPWVVFPGLKLILLVFAVLIPGPYWVNGVLMAGLTIEAFVLWKVLDLSNVPTAATSDEPGLLILHIMSAVCLFAFRISYDRVVRELAITRSRADMLEQMARILLSIRDRSNTPIQTLTFAAKLLQIKHPEAKDLAETVSRSTECLAQTSAVLSHFESRVTWPRGDLMTDEEIRHWIEKT